MMMCAPPFPHRGQWRALVRDCRGSAVIETAFVAPLLLLLALGGVETGTMVARQSELQSAAAEAASIVRASPPETAEQRTTVHDVIKVSANLRDEDVAITQQFRCGTDDEYIDDKTICENGVKVSTYLRIVITTTYSPTWTQFGIGSDVDYRVERMVQIS